MDGRQLVFENKKYADLRIICEDDTYDVHKAIICPQAEFFDKGCGDPVSTDHHFKEGIKNEFTLEEIDSNAVRRMILYFYFGDYIQDLPSTCASRTENTASKKGGKKPKNLSATGPACAEDASNLVAHVRVYEAAQRYLVPGLKALALQHFKMLASHFWEKPEFIYAAREVYELGADEALQNTVLDIMSKHLKILCDNEAEQLAKDHSLSHEILMRLAVKDADGYL